MKPKEIFTFLVLIVFTYYWQTRVRQGPVYKSSKSLTGKTVILTGGNAGIGKSTAMEIAKRGAKLIIASRNAKKSLEAKKEIVDATKNKNVKVLTLDLEDFDSIRSFAKQVIESEEHIDYLVNNAGLTSHGYGRVFTINHLGHFLLTNLLMDKMKVQSVKRPVRIINLSSVLYKLGSLDWDRLHYDPVGYVENFKVYCDSKLANIYFTSELDRRLRRFNITTFAVHPGYIASDLGNNILNFYYPLYRLLSTIFLRESYYGAQTTMFAMLDEAVTSQSGKYLSDCAVEELWSHATNLTVAQQLWERSAQMVGLA